MRNWLIRLLGGMTREEAEFLRLQLSGIDRILETTLEMGRAIESLRTELSPRSGEPVARPSQKQPIKTASEPWTIRKKRLEVEDLRRVREEQTAKHEVGNGSNGPSEAAFR